MELKSYSQVDLNDPLKPSNKYRSHRFKIEKVLIAVVILNILLIALVSVIIARIDKIAVKIAGFESKEKESTSGKYQFIPSFFDWDFHIDNPNIFSSVMYQKN